MSRHVWDLYSPLLPRRLQLEAHISVRRLLATLSGMPDARGRCALVSFVGADFSRCTLHVQRNPAVWVGPCVFVLTPHEALSLEEALRALGVRVL